jgi:hypothetical protein
MAESPSDRESNDARTPRWVKFFAVIAVIVVVLFLVMMLTGGPGRHGPGRHFRSELVGSVNPTASLPPAR